MFETSNRRHFQRGLDCDAARATRRSAQLSLRRKQREEHLQKKFRLSSNSTRLSTTNGETHSPSLKSLSKYIANIMKPGDESSHLRGLTAIRILLSVERSPPTPHITQSGAVPRIVQFLFTERDQPPSEIQRKCQLEAAWIVTNIAASTSEYVACVVQNGAIRGLVDLFRHARDPEIANQAIWGLGNIAGEGKHMKDSILSSGVMKDIIRVMEDCTSPRFDTELRKNAIWFMSNLFRYTNTLRLPEVRQIVPVITQLIRETKQENIIVDCLWALVYLSNQNDSIMAYLCENGTVGICMKLLHTEVGKYEIALSQLQGKSGSNGTGTQYRFAGKQRGENMAQNLQNITKEAMLKMSHAVYRPALRIIGSILSGEDSLTQIVLDAGYLDIVEPFMFHFLGSQRKEAFWSLANILAGSHQQIEAVLSRPSLVDRIVKAAGEEMMGCRKEACWGICNATQDCITQQKKTLAAAGAIEGLCSILAPGISLNDMNINVIIEGLEGFLEVYGHGPDTWNPYAQKIEECGGLTFLEERSGDTNISEDTWHVICELMKKYWGEEENEFCVTVDDTPANIDTSTKQFRFGANNGVISDENDAKIANAAAMRFEF